MEINRVRFTHGMSSAEATQKVIALSLIIACRPQRYATTRLHHSHRRPQPLHVVTTVFCAIAVSKPVPQFNRRTPVSDRARPRRPSGTRRRQGRAYQGIGDFSGCQHDPFLPTSGLFRRTSATAIHQHNVTRPEYSREANLRPPIQHKTRHPGFNVSPGASETDKWRLSHSRRNNWPGESN